MPSCCCCICGGVGGEGGVGGDAEAAAAAATGIGAGAGAGAAEPAGGAMDGGATTVSGGLPVETTVSAGLIDDTTDSVGEGRRGEELSAPDATLDASLQVEPGGVEGAGI